ncbi:hypothetical protein [Halobacterium yunchengense]|uniref:hypothetical protein n=1 Tax=Halobacterium yunchengense TaxID=3108497 RepID=UPI003007FB75
MSLEGEKVAFGVGGVLICFGVFLYIIGAPNALTLLAFSVSVGSGVYGWRKKKKVAALESALNGLLEEKEDLKEELEETESKKQLKSQRLRNLKQVLDREGIDVDYLVEKYGQPLKAPLLVLTHFKSENGWNTSEGEQFIRDQLDKLDTKILHGATRVIPPRSIDQDIETRAELEEWFHEEVLGGRENLTYKLELFSVIDLRQVFGQDKAGDDSQFEMNTIDELFDTEPVVPTDDLLSMLARSDRISMEEELRENIALLAIPYATEEQMRDLISSQSSIQDRLGNLTQIGNTDEQEIERVLGEHEIEGAKELAEGIKQEALSLEAVLNGDRSGLQTDSSSKTSTEPTGA